MDGNIIDIKRFTIHDGPGIRSTVFLKGCPLKCLWCHNPEGIENRLNLWYFESKCIKCNKCIAACPNKALSIGSDNEPYIKIDRALCQGCSKCIEVCPTSALCFDGKLMSSKEVADILLEDKAFYDQSGGGITISGGEPTFQYGFSLEILKLCKVQGVHTAIETCMHANWNVLEKFIDYVDLFIVDIKLFDSKKHEKYTGVGNELILANFKKLVSRNVDIHARIPLIPRMTATDDNIRDIAKFIHNLNNNIPLELMNYNPLAENKYRLMNKEHEELKSMKPFSLNELEHFYRIIEEEGLTAIRDI